MHARAALGLYVNELTQLILIKEQGATYQEKLQLQSYSDLSLYFPC